MVSIMFTAKDFLKQPCGEAKYRKLPDQLKADPTRLMLEFTEIAIDKCESFDFRSRSLMLLSRHSAELGTVGESSVIERLLAAFEKEFPVEILKGISSPTQQKDCLPEAFLAHLFSLVFAEIAPQRAEKSIEAVRNALKGSALGNILERHLETIKRNKASRTGG